MTVSPRDDSIDRLVRRHLDREEAKIDPASVLAGVRARAARPAPSFRYRIVRWSAGFAGMAAALWLLLWGLPTNTASAESLLIQAKEVHSAPIDRLYRIDAQLGLNWFRRPAVLEFQRKLQLWTRGDRFYLMTGGENHQWAWGKDEKGRYWLALNAKVGLIFDADEIDDVPLTTDLYSMKLESLLDELPKGFELKREEIAGRPGFARIVATRKQSLPNQRLREASLELDTTTKVINKLTLKRAIRGETTVSIDYTLIDTKTLPDGDYQLAGHLDPDGTQFGPEKAPFRNGIWKRVLERRGLAP